MPRGGKRDGAGRRHGSNRYGESTHPLRIPKSRLNEVKAWLTQGMNQFSLPLFTSTVQAGLPSIVDDSIEGHIDLNAYVSKQPGDAFLVVAAGNSMINANIYDGDMLVVNKNKTAVSNSIVVAAVAGELTVKRLQVLKGKIQLIAENPLFPPLNIEDEISFIILGVVTHVIHAT